MRYVKKNTAKKPLPLPSLKDLDAILSYEADTGLLRWKKLPWPAHCFSGKVAGCRVGKYYTIKISGVLYQASRVIWKLAHGVDPAGEIDYKNGDVWDNTLPNLRDASQMDTRRNRKRRNDSSSPYKGITCDMSRSTDKCWRAKIVVNYQPIHLGWFETPEEASLAYQEGAQRYHGEFAREDGRPS